MTIKLRLTSEEDEDFLREIEIDSKRTFLDLHNFLQGNLHLKKGQMASFFSTDEDWEEDEEITLMDMNPDDSSNAYTMDSTKLSEFISEPEQKFLYLYDFFKEKNLYMEVLEINNKPCPSPKCIKSEGNAPEQVDVEDSFDEEDDSLAYKNIKNKKEIDDIFNDFDDDYDDDDYDNDAISYTDNFDDF